MKKREFTVSLKLPEAPASVIMVSPDFHGSRILSSTYSEGVLRIMVNSLKYYDVIVLEYPPSSFILPYTSPPSPGSEGGLRTVQIR